MTVVIESPSVKADLRDSGVVLRLQGVDKIFHDINEAGGSVKETILAMLDRESHRTRIEALTGVDLEVRAGEMLGVVGPNGSGKSTLLKIMAGITQPTRGEARSQGRVIGMIELGAGFHFDLTGEENVRLQGSVYGLSPREIETIMDTVFDFAGVGDFRRTPLRFYSSGMIARLGFAIAIHCRPDILLVDEVIAVGDQDFQTKCLRTMRGLKERGVAIILVTHAMDLAERVCDRIVWLRDGRVAAQGNATEVLAAYRRERIERIFGKSEGHLTFERIMTGLPGRFGSGEARIVNVRTLDTAGNERHNFAPGEPFGVELEFQAPPEIPEVETSLTLEFELGLAMAVWASSQGNRRYRPEGGRGFIRLWFDRPMLQPGHYTYSPAITPVGGFDRHYDLHFRLHHFTITDPLGNAPSVPLLLDATLHPVQTGLPSG